MAPIGSASGARPSTPGHMTQAPLSPACTPELRSCGHLLTSLRARSCARSPAQSDADPESNCAPGGPAASPCPPAVPRSQPLDCASVCSASRIHWWRQITLASGSDT
jgi:hypothetical protein